MDTSMYTEAIMGGEIYVVTFYFTEKKIPPPHRWRKSVFHWRLSLKYVDRYVDR